MSDVFISYSRKDQLFVRKLHDSLQADGRDTWVDWSDIPPTAEFMKEIYAGIEAADTFVFVISPDSVSSRVCGEEISYAIEFKKRLVPIMYRDVETNEIHPALASHNWIYCRDTDDFMTAFKTLVEAIETDLELARMHSRLLVRARDWESHGKDFSLLLRGKDLETAERWLAESTGKKPAPISLHAQYLAASRRATTRRWRVALYASIAGVVIAILILYFSYVLFQVSRGRKDILAIDQTLVKSYEQTIQVLQTELQSAHATMTAGR
jgi:hypothetical protein